MAARKTPTMQLIEIRHGEPIDQLLYRLYVEEGKSMAEVAEYLGLSQAAVCRWIERLRIKERADQAATAAV